MKKLMMLLAVIGLSMVSYAQIMVATLQHGDSLRVFYYANAFVDAYNAAVAGDVITLSEGSFTTCTINKDSLTIRGAGIDKTFLPSQFDLGSYTNPAIHSITMEGIYCGGRITQYSDVKVNFMNMRFKCYYGNSGNNAATTNGEFVNCIVDRFEPHYGTPTFINCLVNAFGGNSKETYVNCVVSGNYYYDNKSFINSILVYTYQTSSSLTLSSTTLAQNCICVTENTMSGNAFSQCVNQNSRMADRSIFSNFGLDALDPERYRLTDSAQAAYLGADGTQVGLYGGFCPYSNASAYPLISRMNVAKQTTADGKLSVDIQVGYRQESESEDNE